MFPNEEQSNQPELSKQEKVRNAINSVKTNTQKVNRNHNSKKVSLGQNTKK